MRAAPLVALAGLALATSSASADTGTLSGKLTDGKAPPAAVGRAYMRAVDVRDGRILGATTVGARGAWKLTVDPGWYVLTASVVRTDKPVVSAIAPVQRVLAGRTTRTVVSLKRTKTPRAKKKRRSGRRAARAATVQSPPFGVQQFTASGPNAVLGRGLAEMLVTAFTGATSGDCGAQQVEVMRRGDILRELALSNSGLVDPSSRIPSGHLIDPAYYVEGHVDTTATTTSWSLQIVDAHTGNAIGGDSGTANGAEIFDAPNGIAQRLLDQICGGDYQVTIDINAQILIAPYFGFGEMIAVVPVKPVTTALPTTSWTGRADVVFKGVNYGGVSGCDVLATPHTGYAQVEIKPSSAPGQIEAHWGGEVQTGTSLDCQGEVIPDGVPPIQPYLATEPSTLIMPASGGTQSVSGALGGGWLNNGTVTVTRFPHGTL